MQNLLSESQDFLLPGYYYAGIGADGKPQGQFFK
jgi:hypothetical protein